MRISIPASTTVSLVERWLPGRGFRIGGGEGLVAMRLTMVAERPRARARFDMLLARGIALVAVALLAAAVLHLFGLPPALALTPLVLLVPGAIFLARSLDERRHVEGADRVARQLRGGLGDDFAVLSRYRPREGEDREVDVVVVGPTGVFAVEVRDLPGDLVCYQDVWYRRGEKQSARLPDSPSRIARWNASRVRADIATRGYAKTAVSPVVLVARGHLVDVASACVPVVEGLPALVAHLAHRDGTAFSPQRTQAIAETLRAKETARS